MEAVGKTEVQGTGLERAGSAAGKQPSEQNGQRLSGPAYLYCRDAFSFYMLQAQKKKKIDRPEPLAHLH